MSGLILVQDAVHEILDRLLAVEIPVRFRLQASFMAGGNRESRSKGPTGFDLLDIREYEPGDDPRSVNWPATAQNGGATLLVNEYAEPREMKVFILVDIGQTMLFGTRRVSKRVLAAEIAGSVALSAHETSDKVACVAYGADGAKYFAPPRSAKFSVLPVIAACLSANDENLGETGDGLVQALAFLPSSRCLVFIISDFLALTAESRQALAQAGALHDVVCVSVEDVRERELPPGRGFYNLEDLATGAQQLIYLTAENRRRYAENWGRHATALAEHMREAGIELHTFSTEEGEADVLKRIAMLSRWTQS